MDFHYQALFPLGPDETEYEKISAEHVSTLKVEGRTILGGDASIRFTYRRATVEERAWMAAREKAATSLRPSIKIPIALMRGSSNMASINSLTPMTA